MKIRIYLYIVNASNQRYQHHSIKSYDRIMSISCEACVHRTSLTPPLFNEVPVPSAVCQESERLCICILSVTILPFSTIFRFECWNCSDSMVIFQFIVL